MSMPPAITADRAGRRASRHARRCRSRAPGRRRPRRRAAPRSCAKLAREAAGGGRGIARADHRDAGPVAAAPGRRCTISDGRRVSSSAQQRADRPLAEEQIARAELATRVNLALGDIAAARCAAPARRRARPDRECASSAASRRAEAREQLAIGDRADIGRADQPQPGDPLGRRHAASSMSGASFAPIVAARFPHAAGRYSRGASTARAARGRATGGRRSNRPNASAATGARWPRPCPPSEEIRSSSSSAEPDGGINQPLSASASASDDAEQGRDALAAPEAQPDRIEMAEQRAAPASIAPGSVAPARKLRAISTAAAPFAASSSSVAAASPLRPVRSTLVAPILPEPIWRRSPAPGSARQHQRRTGSSPADSRAARHMNRAAPVSMFGGQRIRNPCRWTARSPAKAAAASNLAQTSVCLAGRRHERLYPPPWTHAPSPTPLLFFDSGVGGLSVLGPTRALLPDAPIVYAADNAGLSLWHKERGGDRGARARPARAAGRALSTRGLIVIACNTASTIALDHVRAALDLPIVGTVPGDQAGRGAVEDAA